MDMQLLLAYSLAILIGVSLGLIGGGGSILTVPVLVYVSGFNPVLSTAYSLFIVGTTSLVGAANYAQKKLISFKTALIFSVPSFISVFLVRMYLVPVIPEVLFSIGGYEVSKNLGLMVFFALLMLVAAVSMLRKKASAEAEEEVPITYNYPLIFAEGLLVGAITGLVGAGGGFMIIPALVLLAHLPMKLAVGTSLLIIAIKSLIGFMGDVMNIPDIDWVFLSIFSGLAAGGIFLGSYLSNYISAGKLKTVFGYFLFIMAIYILFKEIF